MDQCHLSVAALRWQPFDLRMLSSGGWFPRGGVLAKDGAVDIRNSFV
jgi:hypothetical protein